MPQLSLVNLLIIRLLLQDSSHQADHRNIVWEDNQHIGSAFHLPVQSLTHVVRICTLPGFLRENHKSQDVVLRLDQELCRFGLAGDHGLIDTRR